MSNICLHCNNNETVGNKSCDSCYCDAGDYLERNVERIHALPYLLSAAFLALEQLDQYVEFFDGGNDPQVVEAIKALEEATKLATEQPDNGTQRRG